MCGYSARVEVKCKIKIKFSYTVIKVRCYPNLALPLAKLFTDITSTHPPTDQNPPTPQNPPKPTHPHKEQLSKERIPADIMIRIHIKIQMYHLTLGIRNKREYWRSVITCYVVTSTNILIFLLRDNKKIGHL